MCKTGGVILLPLQSPAPPGVHMKRSSVYLNAPRLFDVSGCRLLSSLPQQHAANLLPVRLSSTLRTHTLLCLLHFTVPSDQQEDLTSTLLPDSHLSSSLRTRTRLRAEECALTPTPASENTQATDNVVSGWTAPVLPVLRHTSGRLRGPLCPMTALLSGELRPRRP